MAGARQNCYRMRARQAARGSFRPRIDNPQKSAYWFSWPHQSSNSVATPTSADRQSHPILSIGKPLIFARHCRRSYGNSISEPTMNRQSRFAAAGWFTRLSFLALGFLLLATAACPPQDLGRVEEDGGLVLGEPDAAVCAPQVLTVMSPFNDIRDTYFTMEINHRS